MHHVKLKIPHLVLRSPVIPAASATGFSFKIGREVSDHLTYSCLSVVYCGIRLSVCKKISFFIATYTIVFFLTYYP